MIESRGRKRELPYTGLEGYYAGSERTPQRSGLSAEEIIQEEAEIGDALLQSIKRHAIEGDAWAKFTNLKRILAGATPDEAALQTLCIFWGMVISRFHVRVYQNPEFELTLTEKIEQMEQLLSGMLATTAEERRLRSGSEEECARLRQDYQRLSQSQQEAASILPASAPSPGVERSRSGRKRTRFRPSGGENRDGFRRWAPDYARPSGFLLGRF